MVDDTLWVFGWTSPIETINITNVASQQWIEHYDGTNLINMAGVVVDKVIYMIGFGKFKDWNQGAARCWMTLDTVTGVLSDTKCNLPAGDGVELTKGYSPLAQDRRSSSAAIYIDHMIYAFGGRFHFFRKRSERLDTWITLDLLSTL